MPGNIWTRWFSSKAISAACTAWTDNWQRRTNSSTGVGEALSSTATCATTARRSTQGIFYDRPDVLTVSLHAHPERFYPFFWGYPEERGHAAGQGSNLNLTMARGTGDAGFQRHLDTALQTITDWQADTLVLALGLDAFVGDPFAGLAVTTQGFVRIGRSIHSLNLPSLIVQEGGYLCPELGDNLAAVLQAWT